MKKNQLKNLLVYIIPVLLVVAGIGYLGSRPQPGDSIASQGNLHIDSTTSAHEDYSTTPPTSGPHVGSKSAWGIFTVQIADELQVHNLEDGGVIVHYTESAISEDDLSTLEGIVNRYSTQVILEPYAGLDSLIVVTAWGKILYLDEANEDQIKAFIGAFKGIDHHER